MKLVCLQLPLWHMRWSKTFMSSLRQATPPRLHRMTNNVVHCRSNNNNHCVCTSGTCRSCQQSQPLLAGAQAPRDECLVSEGVELLTTINLIGEWAIGITDLCAWKVPDAQTVWRLSGARLAPLLILHKLQHNNSWQGTQQMLKPSWCWPAMWQYHPMVLSSGMQDHLDGARP